MLSKSTGLRMKAYIQEGVSGRGLFANFDIRQGETVLHLPERTISNRDMYSIEVHPGIHVDCSTSPAGAVNHSCRANCAVRDGRIVAWECISAGTELTINYRLTEAHLAAPFICKDCDQYMDW